MARFDDARGDLRPLVREAGAPAKCSLVERMTAYGAPGLGVAVIEGGALAFAEGVGVTDTERPRPVEVTTRFQAGSASKALAALAALVLVERGTIDLDDDIGDHLRSWRWPATALTREAPITLRLLLSHQSGLTVHGFSGYAAGAPMPTLLQVLDGAPPANSPRVEVDFVPGSRCRYSGGGYTVLQQLLIDLVGAPFPELMRELVLDPLGMHHSTFAPSFAAEHPDEVATGHYSGGRPLPGRFRTFPEMAAAGLWTTPSDLARFAVGIQRAVAGEGILGRDLAHAMLTRHVRDQGLGPSLEADGASLRFQHGGFVEGTEALFVAYASRGKGAAVMVNTSGGSGLIEELIAALARAFEWPERPEREPVVDRPLDEAVLRAYPGEYELPGARMELTIVRRDDRLALDLGDGEPLALVPRDAAATSFFVPRWVVQLDFVVEANEPPTRLLIDGRTELVRRAPRS